jgi:hypothetical protein
MGKIVASKDTTVERVQMLDAFVRSVGGDPARIRATAEDQRKLARMYELHSTLAEAQR